VQSGTASLTGGTVLIEIADVSDIYAMVNVDEADIGLVRELSPPEARPGPPETQPAKMVELPEGTIEKSQKVRITVESFPDEEFFGVIERISPQSEVVQAIATFKVAIRITSENRSMLIGLLDTHAEATFTSRSVIDKLLVPYEAVRGDPNSDAYGVYVAVPKRDGKGEEPEFRKCRLGMTDGISYEVIEGLEEGEMVYTKLPIKTRREQEEEEASQEREGGR
jgi:HlyD family secretion protein